MQKTENTEIFNIIEPTYFFKNKSWKYIGEEPKKRKKIRNKKTARILFIE